jgi:hypothetical protein
VAVTLTVVALIAVASSLRRAHRPEAHDELAATARPPGVGGNAALPSGTTARALPEPTVPAPAPAGVVLRVAATPAGARLTLDGMAIGNAPFRGVYPKDNRAHVVAATMDGYLSMSSQVSFAEDVDLEMRLARIAPAPAVATKKKRSAPPPTGARPASPSPSAPSSSPAETPAQRPRLEMGDQLPPPTRPKRSIDLENPWSKP